MTEIQARMRLVLEAVLNEQPRESTELLTAGLEDPIADGAAYDMLVDGDPAQDAPEVQELTKDDGGIEQPDEQALLMDDIVAQ